MFIDRKIDLIRFVKEYLGIELKMHQIIMLRLLNVYYSIRGMRKQAMDIIGNMNKTLS